MVDKIVHILALKLILINFVSKVGGAMQILKKPLPGDKFMRIPVVKYVYRKEGFEPICTAPAPYDDVIPNSAETAILFFEDLGGKAIATNKRYNTYKGTLKLVCWLNMKKIGSTVALSSLQEVILANLEANIAQDSYLLGGKIKVSQIDPKRPDPFEKFDFNEPQRQFLTHPYDYFSLVLGYTVMASNSCPPTITLTPAAC